ncbi:hypothetical protein [Alkalilimnicola ehrlichii]|nr:hypothetical protein [Alkalilimnicola ehrlichii]
MIKAFGHFFIPLLLTEVRTPRQQEHEKAHQGEACCLHRRLQNN